MTLLTFFIELRIKNYLSKLKILYIYIYIIHNLNLVNKYFFLALFSIFFSCIVFISIIVNIATYIFSLKVHILSLLYIT